MKKKVLAFVMAAVLLVSAVTVYATVQVTKNTKTEIDASAAETPLRYEAVGQKFSDSTNTVSWVNIWYSGTESWWTEESAGGIKYYINGEWKSMDWNNKNTMVTILTQMKDAGIETIVFDMTNQYGTFAANLKTAAQICAELGLTYCVAVSENSNTLHPEEAAVEITNTLLADSTTSGAYYYKDGKPVLVCYVIKSSYETYKSSITDFTCVWASGENAEYAADKWGWQLNPLYGSIDSTDSMFVTGSIYYSASLGTDPASSDCWSTSLAYLDYNLLKASQQSGLENLIIGAYDDANERNGWGYADTSEAEKGALIQRKDIYGNLTVDGWRDRVADWLSAEGPKIVAGGTLVDGAYKMVNINSGKVLGDQSSGNQYSNGNFIRQSNEAGNTSDYVWLYHVGNDNYRIVRLAAGKSLTANGDYVLQNYDEYNDTQFWKLLANDDGSYSFMNNATGKVIGVENNSTGAEAVLQLQTDDGNNGAQNWDMQPVLLMK